MTAAPSPAWLVVGPSDHGVVILAEQLTRRLDAPMVLRTADPGKLRAGLDRIDGRTGVAHVHFTDQLFGADCAAAARAYVELAGDLAARGIRLGVTLHDLPVDPDDPPRYRRRAQAYATVVAATTAAVIVSSAYESDLLTAFCPGTRPVVIPLPVDAAPAGRPPTGSSGDVTVFGYLYPGKGHRTALDALVVLPPEVGLTVLGRVADGHADLADELRDRAGELGRRITFSGWVDDADIAPRLHAAGIPFVGHERMSASGSIGSWLAAGRRPLVPDVAYTRELARRCPGAVTTYPPSVAALSDALARAHAEPALTWLAPDVVVGPSSSAVAAAYLEAICAGP
jgi:glycosyltransferase involved in cell wall biosynthesis